MKNILIMVDLGKGILVDLVEGVLFITGLLLPQVTVDNLIENSHEMIWLEIVEEEEEEEEEKGKKNKREENIVIDNQRHKNKVLMLTQEKHK